MEWRKGTKFTALTGIWWVFARPLCTSQVLTVVLPAALQCLVNTSQLRINEQHLFINAFLKTGKGKVQLSVPRLLQTAEGYFPRVKATTANWLVSPAKMGTSCGSWCRLGLQMGFLRVHWVIKLQFLDPLLGGGSQEMTKEWVARSSAQSPLELTRYWLSCLQESSRNPPGAPWGRS